MLSLSPRLDLFVFRFPKDYLNASIQGVSFPGISDLLVEQQQISQHPENLNAQSGLKMKRVNVEPTRNNVTYSPNNILSQIGGEFTVTLRKNQGLYNYFMMYETIFYKK